MEDGKVIRQIDWDEVRQYIKDSSKTSSVYIGVDSQQIGKTTRFALAVVIHRESCHGARVFIQTTIVPRIKSIRQRLMKEVELVVSGAYEIVDTVDDRHFEVHIDINPDPLHKSNEVFNEARGWVVGQGFDVRTKPDAFAASYAADHLLRI